MLALLLVFLVGGALCDPLCKEVTKTHPTDLILLVDRSNSISESDFETLKQVLSKFITDGLSKTNNTRIALITYGGDVSLEFNFGDNITAEGAVERINNINRQRLNGVFTVTFNALELASAVLIPEAREDANLYIVLFTDGSSNANGMTRPQATARTIKVANEIKHMRALKIITVGIGNKINRRELLAVSTDGIENSTALIISGFQRLGELLDSYIIKETVCSSIKLPKPSCQNGTFSAGVLVVPLVGTSYLASEVDRVVGKLEQGFSAVNRRVNIAWRNSIEGDTVRDQAFDPRPFEAVPFEPWVWVRMDGKKHGESVLHEIAQYDLTKDETPVMKRYIIIVIDGSVLDYHMPFLKALATDDSVTVIPMDINGNNGQYKLRSLAKMGGYHGKHCLFCGGIHEYSLQKCYTELADDMVCSIHG